MANKFYLKKGDTYPDFLVQLLDEDDVPIDLTGATVLVKISEPGAGNLLISETATVVTPQTGNDIGKVFYVWQAGNTDIVGTYKAEWQVTFSNGKKATFPRGDNPDLFNEVIIQEVVD